jgi:hypothetical protein
MRRIQCDGCSPPMASLLSLHCTNCVLSWGRRHEHGRAVALKVTIESEEFHVASD